MGIRVHRTTRALRVALLLAAICTTARGAAPSDVPPSRESASSGRQVDDAIDEALAWLAQQQHRDGSFPTHRTGQPGVTSLCALAYLSVGHLPGATPYGQQIERAVDFALSCQKDDGLISQLPAGTPSPGRSASAYAHYNHAIASLMLCEVCGIVGKTRSSDIRNAVEQAICFTLAHQTGLDVVPIDQGGWRYLPQPGTRNHSDLSVTSWQLLFLRSAKNAGFDVPTKAVEDALHYIQRCFDPDHGTFVYALNGRNRRPNRALAGAGVLSLSLGGLHESDTAQAVGEWVLRHPFDRYNERVGTRFDRFHYGAFYCSQAMFQLGGRYWDAFYPTLVHTLLTHQDRDGSWQAESGEDRWYGNAYTTALVVLALSPPYQLLPIFQR